jgi:membrane protease YdiL (CAAX protease family)
MKGIPAMVALPAAAAFLIEFPFYLLPGFDPSKLRRPELLAVSCLIPYLVYSIPTGQFRLSGFLMLIAIALVLSFWYQVLPKTPVVDVLFVALAASLYLAKVFDLIYLSPIPKVPFSTLGHIMLIRTCAIAVLAIRGGVAAEFRFLPTKREAWAGLTWFAMMLPAVAATLWSVGLWRMRANPNLLAGVATFFGILWVTALSEEFFFRGLLQQWFSDWTRSGVAALLMASVLFGAAHLGWSHIFPNWRFALVALVFGLFCGLCWRQTRSVQASMVTHAIGATLYKVFFQ